MMIAPITPTWIVIESGTLYHFLDPTLIVGSAISRNNSPATGSLLLWKGARRVDYIQSQKPVSTKPRLFQLRHRPVKNGPESLAPQEPGTHTVAPPSHDGQGFGI